MNVLQPVKNPKDFQMNPGKGLNIILIQSCMLWLTKRWQHLQRSVNLGLALKKVAEREEAGAGGAWDENIEIFFESEQDRQN